MGLEVATYISELVGTNPVGAVDNYATADDHLRLIKSVLQAQFPNFTAAAMNATIAELNILDGALLSTAELNILNGVTSLTADLNVMAGAAAAGLTPAEMAFLNGVTSAIQTQIDGKSAVGHTHAAADVVSGTFADALIAASNVTQHVGAINHDLLLGFVADEHVAHAGVSVIAGTGLTGGGTIAATRTLNVIGGEGIAAAADDIAVDVPGLTAGVVASPQIDSDLILFYDNSLAGHRKLSLRDFRDHMITEEGSFSPTLTGFASPPSPTMHWARTGQIVTLNCNGGFSATSNATTMSITNIPAAIRPAAFPAGQVPCIVRDNGTDQFGHVHISAAGVMTFGLGATTGGFTASGSKGIGGNWSVTYGCLEATV